MREMTHLTHKETNVQPLARETHVASWYLALGEAVPGHGGRTSGRPPERDSALRARALAPAISLAK